MNLTYIFKWGIISIGIVFLTSSCFNDLDTEPIDEDEVTSAKVYDDPSSYKRVLGKLYAGLSVSGQQGPSGQADISGIDEGFGQYLRGYWYHQELTTDEAVIGWNDQTIKDFHEQDWSSSDNFIFAFYSRVFYQISLCNEFLRETTDAKLDSRGVDSSLRGEVQVFRAEARFLRALSYWHALDLFRNVPFVTEADQVGSFFPEQTDGAALFAFLEAELKDIEGTLLPAKTNEYGRADQAAAQMLLAKLYLNAEVYTGQAKFSECVEYCDKIIASGYALDPEYGNLFLADNNESSEIIFPVTYDGVSTRTWGGTTFIIHAAVGGDMDPAAFGIDGGWSGIRTTSGLVNKFPATTGGDVLVNPNPGNTDYPILYVPGAFQGWDPANANTVLASPANDGNYEGYFWFADADTEFKFTDGPAWEVNFGDSDGDGILEANGENIKVANPGFYKVNVNTNDLSYTTTLTEWGIIGDATAGGWDSDTDMAYSVEESAWIIETELAAGELKFRANDDWAINFGDNDADGLLTQDGANIKIPNGGTFRLKLFLDRPDYTYSIEQNKLRWSGDVFYGRPILRNRRHLPIYGRLCY